METLRQQLGLVRQQRSELEARESHLRAAIEGLEDRNMQAQSKPQYIEGGRPKYTHQVSSDQPPPPAS
jgi:hypothetical protein